MIILRKSEERGHANHGWLDSYHTFSFANYYDPDYMGFKSLRVINEDRVEPARGFGTHPHRDMEIITYVLEGALEHKDSIGNGSIIRPGDVQKMSAGTGILHSEYNPSESESVHLLQIWIVPNQRNLPASYEQKNFSEAEKRNHLRLIASTDGRENSVTVYQDVNLYATVLDAGKNVTHQLKEGREVWLQVVRGDVQLNDIMLRAGDGAAIVDETYLKIEAKTASELLLFDLG
ncbi:pirin family protein [Ancylothrix sp. C2]|uniref:pirin family protein n=1 Tax=Ancylothrix sp. D3o TaxID=2953691 RepID=UPI0021BA4AEB|nr:pirin family protein [Ancylothrix sp. D3o]MCT7951805.1 pirin family protein [Ancylothrix sp. D3o]